MLNDGSHMDTHIIYDLTVARLFTCIFNLGLRAVDMLQAPYHLNQALKPLLTKTYFSVF